MSRTKRNSSRLLSSVALSGCCLTVFGVCETASGAVQWAQWITGTENFPSSVSVGSLPGPNAVTYNGSSLIRQTGAGTDYWSPSAPYLSGSVTNAPTPAHMIGVVDFAASHSITFGSPVTNPFVAIVGLGSATEQTQWTFDSPFTIHSFGTGFFGGAGTLTDIGGNTLQGDEGSGVIQFLGTFSSISWTIANGEQSWTDEANITGITIGVVPAPGGLTALGMASVLVVRRRRN